MFEVRDDQIDQSCSFLNIFKKPLTYISQVSNNMDVVGKPRQWWDLGKQNWNGVRNPFIFSEIELGGPKEATSTHTHTVWGRIQTLNSESVGQQDFPWRSPFATMPRKVVIALNETPLKIWQNFIVTFYLFFYANSFSLTHQHSLSSAAYSFIYHISGPYNQEVLITYYISVCYQLRRYHRFSITARAPSRGSLL